MLRCSMTAENENDLDFKGIVELSTPSIFFFNTRLLINYLTVNTFEKDSVSRLP